MKPARWTTSARVLLWFGMLLLTAACSARTPLATLPKPSLAPTENVGDLSPEAVSSLQSLEKLDEYPFYVMRYTGDYSGSSAGAFLRGDQDYACSLFATLGDSGDKFYGRNFDWVFSPSLFLFYDPSDGYASVSMVNLSFLGIDQAEATKLDDVHLAERKALLDAPALPFDGMNEYGLMVAMAAIPSEYSDDASYDRNKPNISSIGIIREVLDHSRNVDEALAIFDQYNIILAGGPPIHYLLADPSGKAVLVEFYEGELVQLPNQAPWHLATNHLRCIAQGDGGCWRYRTMSERLTSMNEQLDLQSSMQLLADVAQSSTQWSAVYNMTAGDINVVIAKNYSENYPFHLDLQSP